MNYLTAVIAVPLFVLIWIFEIYLFRNKNGSAGVMSRRLVLGAVVVSTIQMVSCWFWLFGFVFSTTNNILSEAMEDDEEMDCFGLVGAEVLLSIFQLIFSTMTLVECQLVRNLAFNKPRTSSDDKLAILFCSILSVYTVLAWFTAHNRRCPQGTKVLEVIQHHFYPVYLLIDCITSFCTLHYAKLALDSKTTAQGPTDSTASQGMLEALDGSAIEAAIQRVSNYKLQCVFAVVGCMFGSLIFVFQFMLNVSWMSVVACIFCVLMYVTYAIRRVISLAMHQQVNMKELLNIGASGEHVDVSKVKTVEEITKALNNKEVYSSFKAFLVGEFSVENLVFWDAIKKFNAKWNNGGVDPLKTVKKKSMASRFTAMSSAPSASSTASSQIKESDTLLTDSKDIELEAKPESKNETEKTIPESKAIAISEEHKAGMVTDIELLYKYFFLDDAPLLLNLPFKIDKQVKAQFDAEGKIKDTGAIAQSVYDTASTSVFKLLATDSWPRYKKKMAKAEAAKTA